MPALPQGYIDFLKKSNGFVWGVRFFGTNLVPKFETDDMLSDVVSANEQLIKHSEYLKHYLFLGSGDENLYAYNTQNKCYEILNLTGHGVRKSFDSFKDLFLDALEFYE